MTTPNAQLNKCPKQEKHSYEIPLNNSTITKAMLSKINQRQNLHPDEYQVLYIFYMHMVVYFGLNFLVCNNVRILQIATELNGFGRVKTLITFPTG